MIILVNARGRHDPPQGIGVMNEVLAVGLARPEVQLAGDVPDLGSGQ
jgi:hypothetical protein